MGAQEVNRFLTHLAIQRKVAASTQNQALNAINFLYKEILEQPFGQTDDIPRAKKPKRPSPEADDNKRVKTTCTI